MKTQVIIPVHSFVDLITNSSSETFVSASAATVKAVKELVNNLFAISGAKSPMTVDDVFTVELVNKYQTRDYDEVFWTKAEYLADQELGEKSKCDPEDNTEDGYESGEGSYIENKIRVALKPEWKDSKDADVAKKIAKTLSGLDNLFSFESVYNG